MSFSHASILQYWLREWNMPAGTIAKGDDYLTGSRGLGLGEWGSGFRCKHF